jgi:hypothetical protein
MSSEEAEEAVESGEEIEEEHDEDKSHVIMSRSFAMVARNEIYSLHPTLCVFVF